MSVVQNIATHEKKYINGNYMVVKLKACLQTIEKFQVLVIYLILMIYLDEEGSILIFNNFSDFF